MISMIHMTSFMIRCLLVLMVSTEFHTPSHGTKCAGVAAAEADNGICGVGVAYDAEIAAHRILDGMVTALTEGRSLVYKNQETYIKSISWGPADDGMRMEKPGTYALKALENGVSYGRNGRGTIFVWASGNGGKYFDHCGADGYVTNHNVIAIGSINHLGRLPYYAEKCPAVLAVAYTGGKSSDTTAFEAPMMGCVTTDVRGGCTSDFMGTSAAAPLASGVIALVLEANPNLSYRDIMHIITQTAKIPSIYGASSWWVNGAGYLVNDHYGFGVLDAGEMVKLAKEWEYVGSRYHCDTMTQLFGGNEGILIPGTSFVAKIQVNTCPKVTAVEHCVIFLTLRYKCRGDIKLTLISPYGTPSILLDYRPRDKSDEGIIDFPFMTTHCWGETPLGTWKLIIDVKESGLSPGKLQKLHMRIFGTSTWLNRRAFKQLGKRPAFQQIEEILKNYKLDNLSIFTNDCKSNMK